MMRGTFCVSAWLETHLDDERNALRQRLHAVEAGDQVERDPALLVHLATQEEVALQVVGREVVLAANGRHDAT